ncbi:Putative two-component system sensor kinase [Gulosibacter sp. 10]|nr:Putative two-component system sensor kinase [Gulosibacter sp. 10]
MVLVLLGGLMETFYSPTGQSTDEGGGFTSTGAAWMSVGSLAAALALAVLVIWRRDRPLLVTLAGAAAGALLQVGPVAAMIGLASLIARRRGGQVVVGAVAAAAAVLVSTITDAYFSARSESIIQQFVVSEAGPAERAEVPVAVAVIIVLLSLGVPTAIGILQRVRGSEAAARQSRDVLDVELARSREREEIAREIHDVLGSRLSLLSIKAGAIEVREEEYPKIAGEIADIRWIASQSLDDLRSLLGVVKGESRPVSLTELRRIVEESVVEGQPVGLSIYLNEAEQAPDRLARAVVRVVQEAITNARKHAPGQFLTLSVSGGPGEGIEILAVNPLPERAADAPGTGRGLEGMRERTRMVGGELQAGAVGETFRIAARLPWPVQS